MAHLVEREKWKWIQMIPAEWYTKSLERQTRGRRHFPEPVQYVHNSLDVLDLRTVRSPVQLCPGRILTCSHYTKMSDYLPDGCQWSLYERWWNVTSGAGLKIWAVITRSNSRLSSGRIAHIACSQGGCTTAPLTVFHEVLFTLIYGKLKSIRISIIRKILAVEN